MRPTTPDRTRTFRDVPLNDGSTLRIWGLNTAFVSSTADNEGDLFVDPWSMQITREAGVTNFVLAHHHLSWLRQKQPFEDHLNDVAPVQLFGHVHANRIIMERDWVRLTASATNPDRHEAAWEPGYNIIEINVDRDGTERRLHVQAHVRIWQTAPGGFRAKEDTRKRSKGASPVPTASSALAKTCKELSVRRSDVSASLRRATATARSSGRKMLGRA
jgi:hypothetical protein